MDSEMILEIKKLLSGIPAGLKLIEKMQDDLQYKAPETFSYTGGTFAKDLQAHKYLLNSLELAIAQEKLEKLLEGTFTLKDYQLLQRIEITPTVVNFLEKYQHELEKMVGMENTTSCVSSLSR